MKTLDAIKSAIGLATNRKRRLRSGRQLFRNRKSPKGPGLRSPEHLEQRLMLSVGTLQDDVPISGLSGMQGSQAFYGLVVPPGQSQLEFQTYGGSGDADLYVRYGAQPTLSSWDFRPYIGGNNETVTVDNPQSGTWYVMLEGFSSYSGVTLVGDYSGDAGGAVTTLQDEVPLSGLGGTQGSESFYELVVPPGQSELEFQTSGGYGDADLYVRFGAQPTLSAWDYRPYVGGNNETVTVDNPQAGTWYVMLQGYSSYSGVTLVGDYSGETGGTVTTLQDDVPISGLSGTQASESFYQLVVPPGQSHLEFQTSGGSGDADLYVRFGAEPTVSAWDYRPYLGGNNETVTVDNPEAGTWYVMLRGYSNYSGVTLVGDYSGETGGTVTTLQDEVPVSGLSGTQGSESFYQLTVPAGQSQLEFQISGGSGDADLYVRFGAQPTLSAWDYRPYLGGNNETVMVDNPEAGTWYVMLRGYTSYSGATLVGDYSGQAGSTVTTLQDGVPVSGLSGTQGSESFYELVVPAGQSQLMLQTTGGSGDADLYVRFGAQPTLSAWDYRPYMGGNNEMVAVDNPQAGTWYVMLRGYSSYSGVTLVGDYSGDAGGTVTTLQDEVPVSGLSGGQGSEIFYELVVPPGQSQLMLQTSGGSGDADLYVRFGAQPTLSAWDYRPYMGGNNETVIVDNPQPGTWHVMLRGYHNYSGVTLVGDYSGGACMEPPDIVWGPAPYGHSPNFWYGRGGTVIDSIVIHTVEGSYTSGLSTLTDPDSGKSAHYVISPEGEIAQIVAVENRAWHATYYNNRSIGIEVAGSASDPNTWNQQNTEALVDLVAWLAVEYAIPVFHPSGTAYDYPNNTFDSAGIVAHSQIQPWNKSDPGPYFPWSQFIASVNAKVTACNGNPAAMSGAEGESSGSFQVAASGFEGGEAMLTFDAIVSPISLPSWSVDGGTGPVSYGPGFSTAASAAPQSIQDSQTADAAMLMLALAQAEFEESEEDLSAQLSLPTNGFAGVPQALEELLSEDLLWSL